MVCIAGRLPLLLQGTGGPRRTVWRSQPGGFYCSPLTWPRRTVRRSQPGGFYCSPLTWPRRTVWRSHQGIAYFFARSFSSADATASPGLEADTAAWQASDCWRACSMGPACNTTVTARSAAQHSRRAPHTQLANLWQAHRSRWAPQQARRESPQWQVLL